MQYECLILLFDILEERDDAVQVFVNFDVPKERDEILIIDIKLNREFYLLDIGTFLVNVKFLNRKRY